MNAHLAGFLASNIGNACKYAFVAMIAGALYVPTRPPCEPSPCSILVPMRAIDHAEIRALIGASVGFAIGLGVRLYERRQRTPRT